MSDFLTEENGKALIIKCPRQFQKSLVDNLTVELKNWQMRPVELYVFEMKDIVQMDPEILRVLTQFSVLLRKNSKYFISLSPSPILRAIFKERGLEQTFCAVDSLEEAYRINAPKVAVAKAAKLDTEFVSPFILAAVQTFETQIGIKLSTRKPYVKKPGANLEGEIDIAGVISLTCPSFSGVISITFAAAVFLKIYEKMLGETHDSINSEVQDCASEVLNIIYGQAKTVLKSKGYELEKALPTVLVGEKLQIHHGRDKLTLVVPFDSEVGSFHLEVAINAA